MAAGISECHYLARCSPVSRSRTSDEGFATRSVHDTESGNPDSSDRRLNEQSSELQTLDDDTTAAERVNDEKRRKVQGSAKKATSTLRSRFMHLYTDYVNQQKHLSKDDKKAQHALHRKLATDAWPRFLANHGFGDAGEYVDEFARKERAWPGEDENHHPFAFTIDAKEALIAVGDRTFVHHIDNMVLTSGKSQTLTKCSMLTHYCNIAYLNRLKYQSDALQIRVVAELCRSPSDDRMKELFQLLDHLYLIRWQVPRSIQGRSEIPPTDPIIEQLQTQVQNCAADPSACERIQSAWELFGQPASVGTSGLTRYQTHRKPRKIDTGFPQKAKVQTIIGEIERERGGAFKLPTLHEVPYLYNMENAPKLWTWSDLRRQYSRHLRIVTEDCNRFYITTCTVGQFSTK